MNPLFIGPVFELIKQALAGLGLDPDAKAKAQAQAFDALVNGTYDQKTAQALALAQIGNNTEDAKGNWWQSGWRPAIGWVCAGALCSQYILRPWVQWVAVVSGHPIPDLPGIDGQLWELMGGMLGLGALRTVEKVRGAA